MVKIAPSLLSADFAKLGEEVAEVKAAGADYLHFDVMDGIFVPNISVGLPVLKSLRKVTDVPIDVHLMIERPIRYVKQFCESGADILTFHVESDTEENIHAAIAATKALGVKAGITLKPGTPVDAVLPFVPEVSLVLVMTVEPGFGGQKFMEDMLPKVAQIRDAAGKDFPVQIDGGIGLGTAAKAAAAGASMFVVGTASFGAPDMAKAIADIRAEAEAAFVY